MSSFPAAGTRGSDKEPTAGSLPAAMHEQIDGRVRLARAVEGGGHGEDDLRRRRQEPWSL